MRVEGLGSERGSGALRAEKAGDGAQQQRGSVVGEESRRTNNFRDTVHL
jgi:hypothetical protein